MRHTFPVVGDDARQKKLKLARHTNSAKRKKRRMT